MNALAHDVGAAHPDRRVPLGAWVSPTHADAPNNVLATLAAHSVVLLGETHTEASHHHWQLQTIAALFDRRPGMVLGFEMFPRRVQPVLDRWSKDELDDATFLREVDWPTIWGIAGELYLPLFQFARLHRLPMLALNIDRATQRRVAAQGFGSMPLSEREGVGEPTPASPFYRTRLFEWFNRHPAAGEDAHAKLQAFERFVRAQQFWDRAMAEAIASAYCKDGPLIIGIMGSGHIEYGDGVPAQLAALEVDGVGTALPWSTDTDYPVAPPPIADLLFGVAPSP